MGQTLKWRQHQYGMILTITIGVSIGGVSAEGDAKDNQSTGALVWKLFAVVMFSYYVIIVIIIITFTLQSKICDQMVANGW
jgi:hypothetical protein